MGKMEKYLLISKSDVIAKIEDRRLKRQKGALSVEYALCDVQEFVEKLPVLDLKEFLEEIIELIMKDYSENVDAETGEHCENWVVDMINDYAMKHGEIIRKKFKEFLDGKSEVNKSDSMPGLPV